MNIIEIKEILNKLALDKNNYCILGSASLVIRGIKETANDIDILITKEEFKKIKDDIESIDYTIVEKIDKTIEWYDNYPLQTLEEMLKNKTKKNLDKDKATIEILKQEISNREKTGEYVDLYDANKNKLNEIVFRKKGKKSIVPNDRYIIVVVGIIKNNNKYLIQKSSKRKDNKYCLPGGHVKKEETSIEAIKNELYEEMKLLLAKDEIKLIKTYQYENAFKDVYIIRKNIDVESLSIEKEEVEEIEFLSIKEIEDKIKNNQFREHNIDIYNDIIKTSIIN